MLILLISTIDGVQPLHIVTTQLPTSLGIIDLEYTAYKLTEMHTIFNVHIHFYDMLEQFTDTLLGDHVWVICTDCLLHYCIRFDEIG